MFTKLGKLMVFVNIFFSVGLLTWAMSLYTNRIDWLDTTTADGKVEGQISLLKKEIERLNRAISEGQSTYQLKKYSMSTSEERADSRARVFDERLKQARAGRFKLQITTDKGAFGEGVMYDTEKEGLDVLGPDLKPLRGLKTLQDEFAAEMRTIEQLQNGQGLLTEQQWADIRDGKTTIAQITELMPKLGISDTRKLHSELSDLIAKEESATNKQSFLYLELQDQAVYLADKRVNWQTLLETLQRREEQLKTVIKKLTGK
ncbi:MAG: hypothetical protein ACRC8S_20790 [Fimbriiglobus sp.]